MSDSKAHLLATLEVRHNALVGFGASGLLALGTFVFFVVIPGSVHPTPYYLALAFVLANSLGALVTAVLTAHTALRVADEAESTEHSENAKQPENTEQPPVSDQP